MPSFKIEIGCDLENHVYWDVKFYDDSKFGDADTAYIVNIANELQKALWKIQALEKGPPTQKQKQAQ